MPLVMAHSCLLIFCVEVYFIADYLPLLVFEAQTEGIAWPAYCYHFYDLTSYLFLDQCHFWCTRSLGSISLAHGWTELLQHFSLALIYLAVMSLSRYIAYFWHSSTHQQTFHFIYHCTSFNCFSPSYYSFSLVKRSCALNVWFDLNLFAIFLTQN